MHVRTVDETKRNLLERIERQRDNAPPPILLLVGRATAPDVSAMAAGFALQTANRQRPGERIAAP
jgi:hypothetical protein